MKLKYLILRNDEKNKLTIKEFAEVEEKNKYYLLYEETYSREAIEVAITNGSKALILTLKTSNLYPQALYAKKIAEAVISLYSSENDQSVELFFDDKDFISKKLGKPEAAGAIKNEPGKSDEMLEKEIEALDELIDDNDTIKNLTDPIKVKKDKYLDSEDEI